MHFLKGNGLKFHCLVSVFANDGSVSVTHGGIEMGQGVNTKVRQVVAAKLGIDISLVKIKSSASITNPNGSTTGGSMGSEVRWFKLTFSDGVGEGVLVYERGPYRESLFIMHETSTSAVRSSSSTGFSKICICIDVVTRGKEWYR